MTAHFKSVDDYIESQPDDVQIALKRVRNAIQKAAPQAEEIISYNMPAYKLHGKQVLFFAGWKQHYSLYPANQRIVDALKDDLAPYEIRKGTVRFPLSQPVPVKLIEQIARLRVQEASERKSAKPRGS